MKSMVYLWTIAICLVVMRSDAFIYQAMVLRKWDKAQQRYQWFVGLGDYHNKQHPVNSDHMAQLQDILGATDRDGIKVFTEDLSTPNSEGRFNCGKFYVNSRGGVLGALTQTCHNLGLEADNLEYRYCRVCSLGPVLNNIGSDPHAFDSVATIKVADMCHEIRQELDTIAAFDDGLLLNKWYKERVAAVEKKLQTLGWHEMGDACIADLICTLGADKTREQFVKKALTFDSSLFDAKLVHAVVNEQKPRVCAIAGGSHIDRASKILQKIGYKQLLQAKPHYQKENDPRQCIGSDVREGGYCMQPQPIDLGAIKKFF